MLDLNKLFWIGATVAIFAFLSKPGKDDVPDIEKELQDEGFINSSNALVFYQKDNGRFAIKHEGYYSKRRMPKVLPYGSMVTIFDEVKGEIEPGSKDAKPVIAMLAKLADGYYVQTRDIRYTT